MPFVKFLSATDKYKFRLSTCEKCEFLFKPTFSCKKCGCFMKIKAKIDSMNCPIGKW